MDRSSAQLAPTSPPSQRKISCDLQLEDTEGDSTATSQEKKIFRTTREYLIRTYVQILGRLRASKLRRGWPRMFARTKKDETLRREQLPRYSESFLMYKYLCLWYSHCFDLRFA